MKSFILALFLLFPLSASAQPTGMPAPDAFAEADEGAPAAPAPVIVTVGDAGPTDVAPAPVPDKAEEVKPPQPIGPPATPPQTVTEAFQDVGFMIEAAKNGWWGIFAGFLIMLLIFVTDKLVDLKAKVGKAALPWVAAGLGILGTIAAQLTTGVHWGQALLQGFTAGVSAVGLWELVFQHFVTKTKVADPDPKE